MPVTVVPKVIPSMLERCLHVPALLTAKTNLHPLATAYSGMRLTGETMRRFQRLQDCLTRT